MRTFIFPVQVMSIIRQLVAFVSKRLSPERYARSIGIRMGEGCRLIQCDYSSEPYLISLGDRVSATKVRFETHDGGVWVLRGSLPRADVIRPISIGSNVFIGYEAVIMPGVSIGNNVIIGARSLVTKDIPDNSVAVGTPARVIKTVEDYAVAIVAKSEMTKHLSAKEKRTFYESKFRRS